MALRDGRRDKGFFDKQFDEIEGIVSKYLDPEYVEKQGEIEPSLRCYTLGRAALNAMPGIRVSYIRGDTRDAMRILFRRFVDVLWESEVCNQKGERNTANDVNLTSLQFSLSAIAFGEGLGFSKKDLEAVARSIPTGRDQLIDSIMAVYQSDRTIYEKLYKPGVYRKLLDVLSAPREKQPGLILKYLNNWEKALQKDGRWGSHQRPTYDGYWCYEAAAVVAAFDIDDSSFIDHEYYPSDLMRWRKG